MHFIYLSFLLMFCFFLCLRFFFYLGIYKYLLFLGLGAPLTLMTFGIS